MLNILFRGGSFVKPVTDVDVHEHLELANEERKPVLSKPILRQEEMWKRGNRGCAGGLGLFWEGVANRVQDGQPIREDCVLRKIFGKIKLRIAEDSRDRVCIVQSQCDCDPP